MAAGNYYLCDYDTSGVTDMGGYEWVLDEEFPETLKEN